MATTQQQLDKIMERVKNLLNRADHPNTPAPEADLCRAKAEKYIKEYRIAEEDLIAEGDGGIVPISKKIQVCPLRSRYAVEYRRLLGTALYHTGCEGVTSSEIIDGEYWTVCEVFGYDIDVRYCEQLFMSARLLFADRMEPKYDPNLSDQQNVYRMRAAGMERIRVAEVMGWVKGGAKVTRLYKAECEARGEDPVLTGKGIDVKAYRDAYRDGFIHEFQMRCWYAQQAADRETGGITLHGRKERVKEAVYAKYPELRPSDAPALPYKDTRTAAQKRRDEMRLLREAAKRADRANKPSARAGHMSGRRAAGEINIKSGQPIKRLED